ncbi:Protein CASC3 [Frankliniella fusca]|uniref:Protein CASC3 n=1 Tax=Frankliniella fusca TaxID=407009 RepID=A0AAE1HSH0_9NEOP|nr:Protein CASC3 [Frankliniella fusca]
MGVCGRKHLCKGGGSHNYQCQRRCEVVDVERRKIFGIHEKRSNWRKPPKFGVERRQFFGVSREHQKFGVF